MMHKGEDYVQGPLNDYLNHREITVEASNVAASEKRAKKLTDVAEQFHHWADRVQESSGAVSSPEYALWRRILSCVGNGTS